MTAPAPDALNVKSFGATGNGVTDDTAAIQACFNAAFPSGQARPQDNRPVYFPGGNYITTLPLNLSNVLGGHIYGAGKHASVITYSGSVTAGNTLAPGADAALTPVIMTDGVAYTKFENFSVAGIPANRPALTTTNNGFGIVVMQYGSRGTSSQNTFENMSFSTFGGNGIISADNLSGGNCENMVVVNCDFDQINGCAFVCPSFNSLNHTIIGGRISNCATASTVAAGTPGNGLAAISGVTTGTITLIQGVLFINNKVDVYFPNGTVIGCTFLGGSNLIVGIVGAPSVIGCTYNGQSTATWIDTEGIPCSLSSCYYNPSSNTGAGVMLRLGGGQANMDACVFGPNAQSGGVTNCVISNAGSTGALSVRACNFVNTPFPPLSFSGGTVTEVVSPPINVAVLPAAVAALTGLRMTVKDYNATVTFAASVIGHGGGSTTVPVVCTGTDWVIS